MNPPPNVSRKTANVFGLVFVLLSIFGILFIVFDRIEPQRLVATIGELNSPVYAILCFVCLALVSQFLVIPSGSLLLIGGGYLIGSLWATLIYTALLPLTGIIVGQITASSSVHSWAAMLLNKKVKIARIVGLLEKEPFTLSAVLRLTPVIPAAIAAMVASTLKIKHTTFVLATLCVGWVRPLFFASIGGAIQSFAQFQQGLSSINEKSMLPLILLATGAILNLVVRCWLRWRLQGSAAK